MAGYTLILSDRAKKDLAIHHKSGDKAIIKRIDRIFEELGDHPYTGIGKPEALKYNNSGLWSRRLDDKNRIVYQVNDEVVTVSVVSAKGHYDDK
jgi:toxin YoeB